MNNLFQIKVKYTRQLENGSFKRVSEHYLFDAMSFTDAEARVYGMQLGVRFLAYRNVKVTNKLNSQKLMLRCCYKLGRLN
jgi:hypothetical protein